MILKSQLATEKQTGLCCECGCEMLEDAQQKPMAHRQHVKVGGRLSDNGEIRR
jgi:hypothetical protein